MRSFSALRTALPALLLLAAGCDGVATDAPPAVVTAAITNGQLDGNDHPYVGLSLFGTLGDDGSVSLYWRCSGALISSDTYLTAGHCTHDPELVPNVAIIWFDGDLSAVLDGLRNGELVGDFVVGTPEPHPQYADFAGFPNTHDVGLVHLWWPFEVSRYAKVAPLGAVDSFLATPSNGRFLEAVGYGLQAVGNKVKPDTEEWTRGVATEKLLDNNSQTSGGWNLQTIDTPRAIPASLLNDPKRIPYAGGGTCFGDSGGPQLLPGSDTIVAVTSFGKNGKCAGTGFHYRVDTATAQDFIFGL